MNDKQAEYLRLLQERNRLKKQMNAKSKEQLAKEELERGFNTHFRATQGTANSTITNVTPVAPQVSSSVLKVASEGSFEADRISKSGKGSRTQKGWGTRTAIGSGPISFEKSHPGADNEAGGIKAGAYSDGVHLQNTGKESDLINDEYDNYESDFENNDGNYVGEEDMINPSYEKEESALDMDLSLVKKISSLGLSQKQQLLSILQRDLTQGNDFSASDYSTKEEDKPSNPVTPYTPTAPAHASSDSSPRATSAKGKDPSLPTHRAPPEGEHTVS